MLVNSPSIGKSMIMLSEVECLNTVQVSIVPSVEDTLFGKLSKVELRNLTCVKYKTI